MSTMELPYQVEPHPVTGVTSGKLGIWLFLASEVMLFGSLFSSYVLLRVGSPPEFWPSGVEAGLSVPIGTFNTLVLIGSSVTMVMSWASLKMNNLGAFKRYLATGSSPPSVGQNSRIRPRSSVCTSHSPGCTPCTSCWASW